LTIVAADKVPKLQVTTMSLGSWTSLDPETLERLAAVFNQCCRRLERVHGESDDLTVRERLVARRLMDLVEQGVIDMDLLEKQALEGLLPEHLR
jgi:hypothetical protein